MDDLDLETEFDDLEDAQLEANPEAFYFALKAALERTPMEPPAALG